MYVQGCWWRRRRKKLMCKNMVRVATKTARLPSHYYCNTPEYVGHTSAPPGLHRTHAHENVEHPRPMTRCEQKTTCEETKAWCVCAPITYNTICCGGRRCPLLCKLVLLALLFLSESLRSQHACSCPSLDAMTQQHTCDRGRPFRCFRANRTPTESWFAATPSRT